VFDLIFDVNLKNYRRQRGLLSRRKGSGEREDRGASQ
jgi:hypothetical protein